MLKAKVKQINISMNFKICSVQVIVQNRFTKDKITCVLG